MTTPPPKSTTSSDLLGLSRLGIGAVSGITAMAETLHRQITGGAAPLGAPRAGRTRGITGLVYGSVRGVARAVGWGIESVLPALSPWLDRVPGLPQREAVLAALNGVLGDHLEASRNPLAIPMSLRRDGQPLALEPEALANALPDAGPKLLVLAHGLCMNDLQWRRRGHDHGAALARDLGYTPVYLHYNTGRAVARNGAELALLLQALVDAWPQPLESLTIVGHSMGGLVARSACQQATAGRLGWPALLKQMVFLGTPHQGSPLERAGRWVDQLLDVSPYTAPFSRLGKLRSAGIQDLRHGRVLADATPVPLPHGVRCHAVAASKQAHPPAHEGGRVQGDGLVPVDSALGRHDDPRLQLRIPPPRQWVGYGLDHFDLLSDEQVYARLKRWLAKG
jgi:pimeloyl-ACP methyl ester carboxylesterase